MELQDIWKKLEEDKLNHPVLGSIRLVKRSRHPVQKLKELYQITIVLSFLLLIGFAALFLVFNGWITKVSLGLLVMGYIFFLITNISAYRRIRGDLPVDHSLKEVLHFTVVFVSANLRFQENAALWIYPVAATAGFLMGGVTALDNFEVIFSHHWIFVGILLIIILVITPICFFTARWLNRKIYGSTLDNLNRLIAELDRPD